MRTPLAPRPAPPSRALIALLALVLAAAACASPATPAPSPADSPVAVVVTAGPAPTAMPSPSPSDTPLPSLSPDPTASPLPSPTPVLGRAAATRVVIADLAIDLPVVKSPPAGAYPYCNVAMNFGKPFGQPGQNKATYIFAHARTGMFGPIYELVMVHRTPNKMVGMLVQVYTSDNQVHTYKIVRVLPHQTTLNRAVAVKTDQLWLQTSEGPHGTPGKTQVLANPVSIAPANPADAHPKPHIVHCG